MQTIKRFISASFLAVLVAGCHTANLPGYPFEHEATSIGTVYRAVWDEGPVRDVRLTAGVFSGFNAYYDVRLFLSDGNLYEQTTVDASEGYEPYRLVQISYPMVIWFRDPTGKRKDFFNEAITAEEYQRRVKAAEEYLRK